MHAIYLIYLHAYFLTHGVVAQWYSDILRIKKSRDRFMRKDFAFCTYLLDVHCDGTDWSIGMASASKYY